MASSVTQTTAPPTPHQPGRLGGRWIDDWRPEDPDFWESTGKPVARRNLFFSVFSEHIGFSIWSLWSVLVLFLPEPVFGIDPAIGVPSSMRACPARGPAALVTPRSSRLPADGDSGTVGLLTTAGEDR